MNTVRDSARRRDVCRGHGDKLAQWPAPSCQRHLAARP